MEGGTKVHDKMRVYKSMVEPFFEHSYLILDFRKERIFVTRFGPS